MMKAVIFDCFGVMLIDSAIGEVRDEVLLQYITEVRKSYKTALLSNISREGLEARFDDSELAKLFDVVAPSAEIGYAKPEAGAYEYVAKQLGVQPSECVMIDDREDLCTGAEQAGMRAIVYRSPSQLREAMDTLLANNASE